MAMAARPRTIITVATMAAVTPLRGCLGVGAAFGCLGGLGGSAACAGSSRSGGGRGSCGSSEGCSSVGGLTSITGGGGSVTALFSIAKL